MKKMCLLLIITAHSFNAFSQSSKDSIPTITPAVTDSLNTAKPTGPDHNMPVVSPDRISPEQNRISNSSDKKKKKKLH